MFRRKCARQDPDVTPVKPRLGRIATIRREGSEAVKDSGASGSVEPQGQTDLEFLVEKILNRSDPKEDMTPRRTRRTPTPRRASGQGVRLCSWFLAGVKNQKQSLTLRQEARERRIISKCETFHRNPAGSQSRPAEPGQQPEASLAWGWVTITAKRRQRDQTLCD